MEIINSKEKRYFNKELEFITPMQLAISKMLEFFNIKFTFTDNSTNKGYSIFEMSEKSIIVLENNFNDKNNIKEIIKPKKKNLIVSSRIASESIEGINVPMISLAKEGDIEYNKSESIFLDDPAFSFDYSHILPFSGKCSVLHGHTSSVLVELIGNLEKGMVLEFGEMKKRIRECIQEIDHKLFISRKYVTEEDSINYRIQFKGPKGEFDLTVPKETTFLLEGEATIENLAQVVIKLVTPKVKEHNIDGIGVYVYEGMNKGAHLLTSIYSTEML